MKHILTIFIFLFASSVCCAKIWRVNNNAGVVADFTTAQAAHNAAASGDTIMIEPSATTYGSLNVTKKLIIFGVGYYLNVANPNSPITKNSLISGPSFNTGSSGSVIAGMVHDGVFTMGINASNITIIRNAGFPISLGNNINNILINSNMNIGVTAKNISSSSNVIIANNFLSYVDIDATPIGVVVSNNVFYSSIKCLGQIFSNNIFMNGSTPDITSSIVSNNIDCRLPGSTGFGTSNGNKGNISPQDVFVGGTVNGNNFTVSYDGDLVLKATSPAKAAGIGGVDCGMFGGSSPYVLSGLPPVPLLTKFVSSGIGSNTTPIQITISAKSNN
jgi:hypothetical protein